MDARHEGRYQRRKAKRLAKIAERNKGHDFEAVASSSSLMKAAKGCTKGVNWKDGTQKWLWCATGNVLELSSVLHHGGNGNRGFKEFTICERGKVRHVRALSFNERVAIRSLCDNAFNDLLQPQLIYDCGASIKGKGTSFADRRVKRFLREHYKRYGRAGYVLHVDFKSYFATIDHEALRAVLSKYITDRKVLDLTMSYARENGTVGLGLGSQVSQMAAVAFTTSIDHIAKDRLRIKHYIRHMDDILAIADKDTLVQLLRRIRAEAERLKLTLHPDKTTIEPLHSGFCFLKARYRIGATGRVHLLPGAKCMKQARRRHRKQAAMEVSGRLPKDTAADAWRAWTGAWQRRWGRCAISLISPTKLADKILEV